MQKGEQQGELLDVLSNVALGIISVEEGQRSVNALFGVEPTIQPLPERKAEFKERCRILVAEDRSNVKLVETFFYYWTEHIDKVDLRTKMRFEKQKTFEVQLRFKTWERNNKKFSIANTLRRGIK